MMAALQLSCGRVQVSDQIWYGNKGMSGAVEFHTLTNDKTDLTFEQWMQIIRTKPLECSSPATFAQGKAEVEKLCSICNCCDYNTKKAIEEYVSKMQTMSVIQ